MPRVDDRNISGVMVRGRQRYRVVLDAGTVAGKRRQVTKTFDTKAEARQWRDRVRGEVSAGRFIQPSRDTLATKVEEWLTAKEGEVRPATLYDYRSGIKPYLDALGETKVQSITRADIEAVVAAQHTAGRSARTVSYALGLLRQVLDRCVEEELVARNVATRVVAKGRPAAEPKAFTAEELAVIVAHLDGQPLAAAFTLTLYGLRRSEVLGLRWADIDTKAGTISVERSRVEKSDIVGDPKTRRGRRVLEVEDRHLLALLKAARGVGDAYVVVDEYGRPMRPERYSDEWRAMLKRAGVRYLDLRAARRSSVTAMRAAGVPDDVVAKWHGHDENVMRHHYSVVHDGRLGAASAALAGVLRPA